MSVISHHDQHTAADLSVLLSAGMASLRASLRRGVGSSRKIEPDALHRSSVVNARLRPGLMESWLLPGSGRIERCRDVSEMTFLAGVPRFVFFTGKGGVGKTSIACASAVWLARAGRTVLLVSTDPASNVGQVFGATVGNTVTRIAGVTGLRALEIDPEQAVAAYRERIIAPMRGELPEADIASMTEQLSGSCTIEIASFNEFTAVLTDETSGYDHVLFDTAPTGHTIRLLQLPGGWSEFLTGGGDASCLGPLSGLDKQKGVYAAAVAALADPHRTRLVHVARPARAALAETPALGPNSARSGSATSSW